MSYDSSALSTPWCCGHLLNLLLVKYIISIQLSFHFSFSLLGNQCGQTTNWFSIREADVPNHHNAPLCSFLVRVASIYPVCHLGEQTTPWGEIIYWVKCPVNVLFLNFHSRGDRVRIGRECKFQNKAHSHRASDPRNNFSHVCVTSTPMFESNF